MKGQHIVNFAEWNYEQHELVLRWEALRATGFPGGSPGVDFCYLEETDTAIAMLVMSAIKRGPLRPEAADQLSRLVDELRGVLPEITGRGAAYFEELASMAEVAIRLSRSANGS